MTLDRSYFDFRLSQRGGMALPAPRDLSPALPSLNSDYSAFEWQIPKSPPAGPPDAKKAASGDEINRWSWREGTRITQTEH